MEQFAAVIVGGGAVGSSLALALANLGYKVALIEKKAFTYSTLEALAARTVALSYASKRIYEALDVWSLIEEHTIPIREINVTIKGQFGASRLINRQLPTEPLGHVVALAKLEECLYAKLKSHSRVVLFENTTLATKKLMPLGWEFTLDTPHQTHSLMASLLIASDGMHSPLRLWQGIEVKRFCYQHIAFIMNMAMQMKQPFTAFERFLKHGAIALLPWQQNLVTCVWTVDKQEHQRLADLTPLAFLQECQQQLTTRMGKIIEIGKIMELPLEMLVAKQAWGARFLLMGNAAHSLHPIAAQGLNLSLRDIWQLYTKLAAAPLKDIGEMHFLQSYVKLRHGDQQRIIWATDKIARFMSGGPLLPWMRSLGLLLFDSMPLFKNYFTQVGMGVE